MTGKDCIATAMTYVGLDEVKKSYLSESPSEQAIDFAQKLKVFLQGVLNEIAIGFVKLTKTEKMESKNGILPYVAINPRLYEVVCVTKNGRKVYPQRVAEGLALDDGEYEITYCYLPQAEETEEIPFGRLISGECIAYGIASEYFLTMGMAEEASAFDQKFRASLKNSVAYHSRPGYVKERVWLS